MINNQPIVFNIDNSDNLNNPAVLAKLNNSNNTTVLLGAGKSAGFLAASPVAYGVIPVSPATEAATVAAPQMYYTRSMSGLPDSCQSAMTQFPTGINH